MANSEATAFIGDFRATCAADYDTAQYYLAQSGCDLVRALDMYYVNVDRGYDPLAGCERDQRRRSRVARRRAAARGQRARPGVLQRGPPRRGAAASAPRCRSRGRPRLRPRGLPHVDHVVRHDGEGWRKLLLQCGVQGEVLREEGSKTTHTTPSGVQILQNEDEREEYQEAREIVQVERGARPAASEGVPILLVQKKDASNMKKHEKLCKANR